MRAASFHLFVNEDSAFLEYEAAWLGNRPPTFRRNATSALSRVKSTEKNLWDLLNLDGKDTSSFETSGVENQVMRRHIPKPLSLKIQDSHVLTISTNYMPSNHTLHKNKITGKTFILCFFRAPVYQESWKEYKQMKILNSYFVCSKKTENSRKSSTCFASASFLIPRLVVAKRAPNGIYPYVQLYLEAILKS